MRERRFAQIHAAGQDWHAPRLDVELFFGCQAHFVGPASETYVCSTREQREKRIRQTLKVATLSQG